MIAAMGIIAIILPTFSWLQPRGPKASWSESFPSSRGGKRFGGDVEVDIVRRVEFSPDGRAVLTVSDANARFRDLVSGRVVELSCDVPGSLERPEPHPLRFAPCLVETRFMEGGRLLLGLVNGRDRLEDIAPSLRIWEVPEGRERTCFPEVGDGSDRPRYALSDDGSTLAYLMGPPGPLTVGVWRGAKDWQPRYFPGSGPIALSVDGRRLALFEKVDSTPSFVVWDVRSSERLSMIPFDLPDRPEGIALSPDGKILAVPRDGQTILWDVATASRLRVMETNVSGQPWFSPDGSLYFPRRWHDDGMPIEIWNLAVEPPQPLFEGQIGALSRAGGLIVQKGPNVRGASGSRVVADFREVVELPSMRVLRARPEKIASSMIFSPDGRTLAWKIDRPEASWLWTLAGWLPSRVRSFPPNWRLDKEVRVLDVDSGRILATIKLPYRPFLSVDQLELLEDRKTLAIHYQIPAQADEGIESEAHVELWSVPSPPSNWPVAGVFVGVALASGRWYDRRSRRRANPSPVVSPA